MLERDIQRKVLKYAKTISYSTSIIKMTDKKGFPDTILFYRKQFFLIEFKSTTGKLSRAQTLFMGNLYMHQGIRTYVINDVEKGKQFLDANKKFIDSHFKIHGLKSSFDEDNYFELYDKYFPIK